MRDVRGGVTIHKGGLFRGPLRSFMLEVLPHYIESHPSIGQNYGWHVPEIPHSCMLIYCSLPPIIATYRALLDYVNGANRTCDNFPLTPTVQAS